MSACGPTRTSGDVRFRAAAKGIADMDRGLIRGVSTYEFANGVKDDGKSIQSDLTIGRDVVRRVNVASSISLFGMNWSMSMVRVLSI